MSINIRRRKLSSGKVQLYLDTYYKGSRKVESMGLSLCDNKEENERILDLAHKIRARRELELQNEAHGFVAYKLNTNFFEYAESYYKTKSRHTRNTYYKVEKYLLQHANRSLTFREINKSFCEGLKKELYAKLKPGTAFVYFSNFKSVLISAMQNNMINHNPTFGIKLPKGERLPRYLTLEELQLLISTHFKHQHIKNAFLFSCWTGLRYSDICKLRWDEVQNGKIEFTQKKTSSDNIIPLSSVAVQILEKQKLLQQNIQGKIKPFSNVVFDLPTIQTINDVLKAKSREATISKRVTFHVARHTFATLSLSSGIDIYTVSKLLGHKDIGTTTIYAKVIDEKRKDAVSKLPVLQI